MNSPNNSTQFKPNGTGVSRIFKALFCTIKGLKAAYINESAFRQELLLCLVLLPFSFVIASTVNQWTALIVSLLLLLFAELINSAIEALADRISIEHHELIGRAKDMGSAAVFISFTIGILIWGNVLYYFIKEF